METSAPLPPVAVHEISLRGRIDPKSSWHAAKRRVLALRRDDTLAAAASWEALLQALGGRTDLAGRRAAELAATVDAVNRIIPVLNGLPPQAGYGELETALGLAPSQPTPSPAHDRIGEAMNRVLENLEARRGGGSKLHALG